MTAPHGHMSIPQWSDKHRHVIRQIDWDESSPDRPRNSGWYRIVVCKNCSIWHVADEMWDCVDRREMDLAIMWWDLLNMSNTQRRCICRGAWYGPWRRAMDDECKAQELARSVGRSQTDQGPTTL